MNRLITLCALAATTCLGVTPAESQAGHRHARSRGNSSVGCYQVQHQHVQEACCGSNASYSAPVTTIPSNDCCGSGVQGYSGTYNGQAMHGQQMMNSNGAMHQDGGLPYSTSSQGSQLYGAPNYSSHKSGIDNSSANQNWGNSVNGQRTGVNAQSSVNSQGINAGLNANNGNTQFQGRPNANARINTGIEGIQAGSDVSGNNNAAGSNTGNSGVRVNADQNGASLDTRSNINAGGSVDSAAGNVDTNATGNVDVNAAADL